VTKATQDAQAISNRLYEASQRQSREIQQASGSVLQMAQSIGEVSQSAAQSAKVAQQSLSAAEKGAQSVQNQISGMHEIRAQIQDTSKRIKRLGESSLEIGDIVELIADITEQTNILALNAAIQAASAGEAGRGFTVVAEEVQRLAERSGEATKQIDAIVKTIQADTQDAVAAMEKLIFPDPWSHGAFEEVLVLPIGMNLVAVDHCGRPCGYLCAQAVADEIQIHNIAVAPESRRQGIGRMLLEHAEREASARGAVCAILEVRVTNTAALAMYGRMGYHRIGRRRAYYRKPVCDALVLLKMIDGARAETIRQDAR
jgi:ribosomal-protein-alanine acetyltransferase